MGRGTPGRKRKEGERKPSGDLKQVNLGRTPEQAMRCAFLVGPKDPRFCESPMGVLRAHSLVSDETWRLTDDIRAAKKRTYGSYLPSMRGDGSGQGHDALEETKSDLWAANTLETADRVLKALPNRRCRDIFHNFSVEERFPAWMQQHHGERRLVLIPEHIPELALILAILEQLADVFNVRSSRPDEANVVRRNFQQGAGEKNGA